MNNHLIDDTQQFSTAFIDSGTTFTYIPNKLLQILTVHFDWYCSQGSHHCKGKRIKEGANQRTICFEYDENEFQEGPKKYFMSYPVLNIHVKTGNT